MAQGASVRQYYLNYVSRIFFHVRSAITIGAGYIGAPIYWRIIRKLCSVRLPYFHTNRPLNEHYKQEMEIR
jgi:hypothetical protein